MPSANLSAGMLGTVVLIYGGNPPVYEVEFTDDEGITLAMLTLEQDDIEKAWDANSKKFLRYDLSTTA